MRQSIQKNAFTLWLLAAVILAVWFPGPGSSGGFLFPEVTTKLGVWVIFFLQGLGLPTSELAAGYKPKRLHGFVLSWNYLLFPAVVGLFAWPFSLFLDKGFVIGFWLLAVMPTTVSSAVVFTTVSGGNTSNAIFSTVCSNLLSILLVPAIAVVYLTAETQAQVPILPLFRTLILLIVFPLILGQIVRKADPVKAGAVAKRTKPVGNWIILLIVHCAFAGSVSSGFLDGVGVVAVAEVILSTVGLLLLASAIVWRSSGWLRVERASRISGFFCASQKSLATGLPLATSILVAAPDVVDAAAVLTPLMVYHPCQLVLAGWLSGRWAKS